jgi:hypothetical protein
MARLPSTIHHMILRYLLVGTIFALPVLGFCFHENGDPCNGDLSCCLNDTTIAQCNWPIYDSTGHWEVSACGGTYNVCIDDESDARQAGRKPQHSVNSVNSRNSMKFHEIYVVKFGGIWRNFMNSSNSPNDVVFDPPDAGAQCDY